MSQALIRAAFEQKLATWAAAQTPAVLVAWENVAFTAPAGRYVRAFLLPLPTETDFLSGTDRQFAGVFQLHLLIAQGAGPGEAEALITSLDTAFGLRLTNGSLVVTLTRPLSADGAGEPDADRYLVPVSCAYRAATAP
ncbi:MAG: hypothetical protein EOP35_04115 [Rubrivivax sp.]|nr:MAG: hypothetical protein EOP35_04115 [Rubrivivax sp.]